MDLSKNLNCISCSVYFFIWHRRTGFSLFCLLNFLFQHVSEPFYYYLMEEMEPPSWRKSAIQINDLPMLLCAQDV